MRVVALFLSQNEKNKRSAFSWFSTLFFYTFSFLFFFTFFFSNVTWNVGVWCKRGRLCSRSRTAVGAPLHSHFWRRVEKETSGSKNNKHGNNTPLG